MLTHGTFPDGWVEAWYETPCQISEPFGEEAWCDAASGSMNPGPEAVQNAFIPSFDAGGFKPNSGFRPYGVSHSTDLVERTIGGQVERT
ncbi:MAG: hypothetical protein AAGF59_07740 [Pseudomonadota bacterium]